MAENQIATFRFAGARQDTGDRHIQTAELVELQNFRQLKGGEYRKRRGFSRTDPIETLIIDNNISRRSPGVFTQSQLSLNDIFIAVTSTEVVAGGNVESNAIIPWRFSSLGASIIQVGASGRITPVTNPCTVRLRVGGVPTNRTDVAGTVRASETFAGAATHSMDIISGVFTIPSSDSYMQLTFDADSGNTDVGLSALTIWARAYGSDKQGMLLASETNFTRNVASELVKQNWLVDFGLMHANVANVMFAPCIRALQAGGSNSCTYRLRLGGTVDGNDGTIVASWSSTATTADGVLSSTVATAAKPSGIQLLKFSMEPASGVTANVNGLSVIVRAVD